LPIQGYDLILGLDWLAQFGPMVVDWNSKWVQFEMGGKTVKLQVQKEIVEISLCEAVNVSKEILAVSLWWPKFGCVAEDLHIPSLQAPAALQPRLNRFASVFESITALPPAREIDHEIPLLPNAKPVNLRPYRYSYFQKLEIEKIMTELL
jgi:hypothetical protein